MRTVVAGLCAGMLLAGCGQSMYTQPKYNTYAPDPTAPQGTSARLLVPGVQPRGQVAPAKPPDRTPTIPVPVTMALLKRGQERFDIYCAPCHGRAGDGDGILPAYGFPRPPSFTKPRPLMATDRHFYEVITKGKDKMYSYADRVAPPERWAIVAYIRALQRSQHATPADVPKGTKLAEQNP